MATGATAALLLALLAPLAHGMECPNEGWCSAICTGSRVKPSILHSAHGWSSARHRHFVLGCLRCDSAACSTGVAREYGKSIPQAAGRQMDTMASPTDASPTIHVQPVNPTATPTLGTGDQQASTVPASVGPTGTTTVLASVGPTGTTHVSPTSRPPPNDPPPADLQACLVDGVSHPLYSTWTSASNCTLNVCTEDGVNAIDLSGMCMPEPQNLGECAAYRQPDQCCYNYNCTLASDGNDGTCVDEQGVVRQGGEMWHDSDQYPCVTYVCVRGEQRLLSDMRPLCPAAPDDACVPHRLAGQCCHNFNCSLVQHHHSLLCLFALTGVTYQHLDEWYDDELHPCIKYVCVSGFTHVLVDKHDTCPPPPLEGCREDPQLGQCCPVYAECPCMVQGVLHQHGTMFPNNANHPCHRLLCTNGTTTVVQSTTCELLACSQTVWPNGECCRQCAGCVVDGVTYAEGSTWPDSTDRPCTTFQCVNSQVVTVETLTCQPAPRPGCTPWHTSGNCCPKWDCEEGPCEHNEAYHDHGTTWPDDPLRPCVIYRCNNSAVVVEHQQPDCPSSPGPHCLEREVPYQCCPVYDCFNFTCPYKDRTYLEGDVWGDHPEHPCKWYTCLRTGVTVLNVTVCPPLDPPRCVAKRPLGSCCKVCAFSDITLCRDEDGNPQPDGAIYYKDATHCLLVTCVNTTEVTVADLSTCCPPPPAPNCVTVGLDDCCPVYHCPNTDCVDAHGTPRADGELYYTDPSRCVLVRCDNTAEVTVLDLTTSCDPPPDNDACIATGVVDCCPVYDCPNHCTHQQQQYSVGSTWWDNPQRQCVQYHCKPNGIVVELQNKLPCAGVRPGCMPVRQPPACCHHKYNCMFDVGHSLIVMAVA